MQQEVNQEVPRIELEKYKDFKYRAKNFYHIRTEDSKLKKFDFTQPQEYFNQIVQEEFERTEKQFGTKKCNVIILKPRRMGATTFFSIFGIDQMIMNDMYQGLMIAHDTDTSDAVYDMYKRCYDYLPESFIPTEDGEELKDENGKPVHIKLKPDDKSYSGKRLSFEDNDSLLTVRTAGAGDAVGKSIGLNFFHGCLSEDSLVILSDGTSKSIKDIQQGDKVITHNGHVAPVKENFYTGVKQTYRISVEGTDQTISVTEDHKILTEEGWLQLKDINKGQYIVQAPHSCVDAISGKILSIDEDRVVDVYDLEIDHEDHSYQTPVGIVSNSEAGNWPEFNDTLTSLNQALDMGAETLCVIESTANGVSGIGEGFYNLWNKSKKSWEKFQAGKTQTFEGFRPIFIPWYLIDKYRRPLAGGKLIDVEDAFPTEEQKNEYLEQEERLRNGVRNPVTGEMVYVDEEQLNWRRWYFKEKCNYDYNKLKRYYPTTDEEAFTASNVCYFDSQKLSEVKTYYLHEKQKDYKIGDMIWDDNSEVSFKKNPLGSFKIWEEPEDKWENRYIVSIDPAYGYDDGDYAVIKVFDRLKQSFPARWHGKVDEDILAEIATKVGLYYNEALLIPERNLKTVVNILKPDGIHPYVGEIYWEESGRDLKYGKYMGNDRKVILDMYRAWLREDYYKLPDAAEVDEHLSFVKKETKRGSVDTAKYEADEGEHDDIVIANALAVYADNWYDRSPKERTFKKLTDMISKPKRRNRKSWKQSSLGKRRSTKI